jgi:hypothetical protein
MTFVYAKNGKAMGDAGCHDDRVMALAGAYELYKEFAQSTPTAKKEEKTHYPGHFSEGSAFTPAALSANIAR